MDGLSCHVETTSSENLKIFSKHRLSNSKLHRSSKSINFVANVYYYILDIMLIIWRS
jgi:hypothetical protein